MAAAGADAGGADEIGGKKSVARFLVADGDQIGGDNRPTDAAFRIEHILEGLSVDVTEPGAAAAASVARHSAAMKKPYRYALARVEGAQQAPAEKKQISIRAIADDEGRSVFRVVADPVEGDAETEENPDHALICFARRYGKREVRILRERLRKVFGNVVA